LINESSLESSGGEYKYIYTVGLNMNPNLYNMNGNLKKWKYQTEQYYEKGIIIGYIVLNRIPIESSRNILRDSNIIGSLFIIDPY
jgi:hypothetical protein